MTTHHLDFCKLKLHDDYIFVIMNKGIIVDEEKNDILIEIANKFYSDIPFVYISHRINSYAVDPMVYKKAAEIKTLIGFAVVSSDPIQIDQCKYEGTFFSKEFKQFNTIEDALLWKDQILRK